MEVRRMFVKAMPMDDDDEKKPRRTRVVASTAGVDRYGDIVDQASWQLASFKANPVILWGHDYGTPPVGRAVAVETSTGDLVAEIEWDTGAHNPLGTLVAEQFARGVLSAVSVGFKPSQVVPRASLPKDDPRWGERGYWLAGNELLEISAVAIPANPEALAMRGAARDLRAELLSLLDDPVVQAAMDARVARALEDVTPPETPDPMASLFGLR